MTDTPTAHAGARQDSTPEQAAPATDQWDSALRGQKMSNATGKVIFKYQMPVLERFTMRLPRGAQIIRMADQGGMFWLWAVVDTRQPDEDRQFYAVKHILRLNQAVLHKVDTRIAPGVRTFIKVSVSNHRYALRGNSINHDLATDWIYEDRQAERNCPAGASAQIGGAA